MSVSVLRATNAAAGFAARHSRGSTELPGARKYRSRRPETVDGGTGRCPAVVRYGFRGGLREGAYSVDLSDGGSAAAIAGRSRNVLCGVPDLWSSLEGGAAVPSRSTAGYRTAWEDRPGRQHGTGRRCDCGLQVFEG